MDTPSTGVGNTIKVLKKCFEDNRTTCQAVSEDVRRQKKKVYNLWFNNINNEIIILKYNGDM